MQRRPCAQHANHILRRVSQRRGAAIVEMALMLPVFFMVMLGIVEFGRAFMVGQLITNSAREGARLAVTGSASNAAITQNIKDFLAQSGKINGSDVSVTITVSPYPGNPAPAGNDVSSCSSRDLISVKVDVPFSKVSFLPPTYLKTTKLSAQAAMRFE